MAIEPRTQTGRTPAGILSAHAGQREDLLVAAAKGGDATAFSELVERNERRIFRLAQNITRNREDAEDVLQDSFVQAFAHLEDFQGDARFSTWLTRIAINQALMKLRKRRANLFPLDERMETEDGSLPREIVDWSPTPEQRYSQVELRQILAEAMGRLSPTLRIVFQLRDVEEFSTEETAEILGISISAVKARALRARLALREELNRFFQSGQPAAGEVGRHS